MYRSGSPPPRQAFTPSSLGRSPSRATSASFRGMSSATPPSGSASAAGTPSRRQNKRGSVIVVLPDAAPTEQVPVQQLQPPSAPSSRVSSAEGYRGELSPGRTTATPMPIPTAPKRPSLTTNNSSAFSAAAATTVAATSATGSPSRQRTSLDFTAAPGSSSVSAAGDEQVAAAAEPSRNVAGILQAPPAASPQQPKQPPWLISSALDPAEPSDTADNSVDKAAASGPRSAAPPLPPAHSQQQQQQTHNTNNVCEGIVNGVRHAAGGAGLGSLGAPGGLPSIAPPVGYAQSVTTATSHMAPGTASPPATSCTTNPGRRISGRYTGPALPRYSGTPQAEKRTSNPFTSYSADLFAGDGSSQGGSGGIMITPPPLPGTDSSNTGDLALQCQPQQVQRASAAVQRNTAECNEDLQQLVAEAHAAYTQAEARLLDEGLSLIGDWMRTRDLFFSAGSLFAAVGDAETAARCLLHATFINRAFHNEEEAMTTLAMSVDQLKHAHPRVAVESLLRLAPCYAQRQLRYQTARCYRDAAELMETELEDEAAAIDLYRVALEIYADSRVAAKSLSRAWDRERRQQAQRTASTMPHTNTAVAVVPSPGVNGQADPREASLSASLAEMGNTAVTARNMKAGVPPPHYQVSTTVQRSLIEGCRGRLLVLLTRLHRYPEVLEVALTCAEEVHSALPRTKYLLSATLSVLARGAALPHAPSTPEAEASGSGGGVDSAAPLNLFMSAKAEAADTLYFDSLYDTEKIFSSLQEEDRAFQRGKENELVRALLAANAACSLTVFDEAVRKYKGYASTEPNVVVDMLVEQCRRSLFEHVERFA